MGFVKYMNFTHLSEADKKALKKKLENSEEGASGRVEESLCQGKKEEGQEKEQEEVGLK